MRGQKATYKQFVITEGFAFVRAQNYPTDRCNLIISDYLPIHLPEKALSIPKFINLDHI